MKQTMMNSRSIRGAAWRIPGLSAILWILMLFPALAQKNQVAADFKKLNEKLGKHRYDFTLTYQLYESYTATMPVETQTLDVKMWDLMVNIKSKEFHVIRNKENYLYVNFRQKVMMLNSVKKYSSDLKQLKEIEKMINLDTLMKVYDKVEELRAGKGLKTYRLYLPENMQYAFVDITFNPSQMLLEKMTVYYSTDLDALNGKPANKKTKDRPRMDMIFSGFRLTQAEDHDQYSISGYVQKQGKSFKPGSSFSRYKFIDNTF